MPQTLRPSTVLPSKRSAHKVTTADGIELVVEVAAPINPSKGALLMCHPNPTGGGMMDSHVYKKAANRLPDLADLTIVRFNTRGTSSKQGTSSGAYDQTKLEKFDVEAMVAFCLDELKLENLWVVGWSFGTELALKYARDPQIKGIIILSPPLMHKTLSIPGLVTIVSALIGASLLGLVGGILAVPIAASILLILEEVVYPKSDQA